MKRVIKTEIPENSISVSKISTSNYIGVNFRGNRSDASRGFVTRKEYVTSFSENKSHFGVFTIRCLPGLTVGNGWDTWNSPDFKTFINNLLTHDVSEIEVYVFDSAKELCNWLLTKD